MKYDIFISYESTTGESFADHLKITLERRKGYNHEVFLANETLTAGDKWRDEIDSALNSCKYFIVVITSLAMDSDWVIREYKKAVEMNKRVIPCRYSKIPVLDTRELANIQQIVFSDKFDLANKVILELRKIDEREKKGIGVEKDAEEFLKRGNLLYSLGKFDDAEKEYQRALKINPHLAQAYYNLDTLHYNLQRSERLAETKTLKKVDETQKPSEIFKFYSDEEEILKELVELYPKVKELLIYAEEVGLKVHLQPHLELVNAFDHLMRVLNNKYSKSIEGDEYSIQNLRNAAAHVYRAGFEVIDFIILSLRKKIVDEIQKVSPEAIIEVFPEYYKEIRPRLEEITNKVVELRSSKELAYHFTFDDYISVIKEMREFYETILSKMSYLIEYENKKRGGFLKKIFK